MSDLPTNQILEGDCIKVMKGLPDNSIHALITDPPYGLEFMGKDWDTFRAKNEINEVSGMLKDQKNFGKLPSFQAKDNVKCPDCGKWKWDYPNRKCLCGGATKLATRQFTSAYQSWTTSWATEALRVLKPGGSLLSLGGTRTYHRLASGIEDAGFTIKDCLLWCYNSGFPKAQDLGKSIDNDYFEEELKKRDPEYSSIKKKIFSENTDKKVARKLWVKWRTDRKMDLGLTREVIGKRTDFSIDGAKRNPEKHRTMTEIGEEIGHDYGYGNVWDTDITQPKTELAKEWNGWKVGGLKPSFEPIIWAVKPPEGSWTENVLKHGVGAINVDECRIPMDNNGDGVWGSSNEGCKPTFCDSETVHDFKSSQHPKGRFPSNQIRTDKFGDGYDRFYFVAKSGRAERDEGLGRLSVKNFRKQDGSAKSHEIFETEGNNRKTGTKAKNIHPTVKPISLMDHLIKLLTRESQVVLDPFAGSGTTCVAARLINRAYIGIEKNEEYAEIARQRLAHIPKALEEFF